MMETHPWNPKLDLANEGMDHDHHLQIALVSALADAIEQRRPWLSRRLAEQLLGYSTAHFATEELLMEASEFGERAVHSGEHRAVLAEIRELGELLTDGADADVLNAALELRGSLERHMASADRRLAGHAAPRLR